MAPTRPLVEDLADIVVDAGADVRRTTAIHSSKPRVVYLATDTPRPDVKVVYWATGVDDSVQRVNVVDSATDVLPSVLWVVVCWATAISPSVMSIPDKPLHLLRGSVVCRAHPSVGSGFEPKNLHFIVFKRAVFGRH